ncbi:MAG: hypothetical protein U0670_06680 [Anaerolineae bacterium]
MQYVTIIEPVLEVTLVGTATPHPWLPLLQAEGLTLSASTDRAIVMISATASTYKGLSFRELSVSIQVEGNRFFLPHADNSIRWFAWVERKFFQTPYRYGQVTTQPMHIAAVEQGIPVFEARLPADASYQEDNEVNELVIHLPKSLRKRADDPHFFYARLEGAAHIYDGHAASVTINAGAAQPIWDLLRRSDFQVNEWRVRQSARHSKSKTYEGSPV